MKKTKVIIPALGVLLLSTAASVTGTVAWFSMNQTVTANNMSVTIKSDAAFLLIGTGAQDLATIKNNKSTTAAGNANVPLFPAAHKDTVTTSATAKSASNWYYKYADLPNASASTKAENAVTDSTLNLYVSINEFRITVADGSNVVDNLRVSSVSISSTVDGAVIDPVRVIVASSNAVEEFPNSATSHTTLASSVDSSDFVAVTVLIYWDGNDNAVYTNNIGSLKNTDVVVTFTGDVHNA